MSGGLGGCDVADLLLPTGRGLFVQGTPVRYTDSSTSGHAPDSEGVEVALEYKIVPLAVNTIGFELNGKKRPAKNI